MNKVYVCGVCVYLYIHQALACVCVCVGRCNLCVCYLLERLFLKSTYYSLKVAVAKSLRKMIAWLTARLVLAFTQRDILGSL